MRTHWSKFLFGATEDKPEPYIPVDQDIIQRIKSAVAQAEPGTALEILQNLNIPAIEPDVLALAGRYNHLQTAQRRGIVSAGEQQLQFNRLNHDLLDLAARLEKSLEPDKALRLVKVNLRKRYQQRLKDKLADRQPINIQCAYTIEGTDPERAKIAYDEIVLEQKAVQSNLEALFDRHRGRLLITGDPGAGKTSLLLQLADALLKRRENRVPVILNLSTWKSSYPTFEAWLLEALPQAAYVSKAMAKTLVQEDRLLPLFDGLDEVAAEHRNSCLSGIAHYGRAATHQYVICSRSAEYAETAGAPVYGQIKVLPLTQAQIVQQLENSNQPEARFLLHALRSQPLLARVVENPFYFNTAQLLLSSMTSLEELQIHADNEEELKAGLVEQFVERQLATPARVDFSAEKSRRWLGFLAKKMEENGLVVFELTDLRLGWIRALVWAYYLSNMTFFTLFILFVLRVDDLFSGIALPVFFTLIWVASSARKFDPVDRISWRLANVREQIKKELITYYWGLFLGLLVYLLPKNRDFFDGKPVVFLGLIACLFLIGIRAVNFTVFFLLLIPVVLTMPFTLQIHVGNELNAGPTLDSPLGPFNNLIFWFIVFFIGFLIRFLVGGIKHNNTIGNSNPYKRIYYTSAYTSIPIFIFVVYAICTIFVTLYKFNIPAKEVKFDVWALGVFLPFTLLAKHLIVRSILSLRALLPFRLATFLNEMTARHLFESDGGSWRFRHKIVQDYFVRRYGSL